MVKRSKVPRPECPSEETYFWAGREHEWIHDEPKALRHSDGRYLATASLQQQKIRIFQRSLFKFKKRNFCLETKIWWFAYRL